MYVSYYRSLSKKFSDTVSVYAVDFMKLSCAVTRDVVFDVFVAGLCRGVGTQQPRAGVELATYARYD